MYHRIHSTLIGIAVAAAISPAQAQSADPTPSASAPTSELEEIVVTALKRETTLQDTPLAISVVSQEDLANAGVQSVADLQNVVPGLQVGRGDFGVTLSIRGVTTTDNTSKGDQGIAFNVDGITIGRPREMSLAMFDIERVEVLRGPQGTLYGKSTTGGVINVITNRPGKDFGAGFDLEYGDFDTTRVTGTLNVPVTDRFSLRGAVAYNNRDGYLPTDNSSPAFNDQEDLSARISGLYEFSDSSSLFVSGTFGNTGGIGAGQVPFSNFVPVGRGVLPNETIKIDSASGESGRTVVGVPEDLIPEIDEDFLNFTAEFTADLGAVRFIYLGGYRDYDANSFSAQSLEPNLPAGPPGQPAVWDWGQYRGAAKTNQQEVRFSNAESARFNWIAGANWYREDLNESDHRWTSPVTDPTREAGIPGIDPVNETDHESYGVFSQIDFGVSDTVNLTAGVRYSKDEVVRAGTFAVGGGQVDANGDPCVFPHDCIGAPNNGHQSDDKVTWRLGIDYKPSASKMFYASIATGYKAGGFNDFDPAIGGPGPYDPEDLTAYEAGFKGSLSSSVSWEAAIYFYDYGAAQISSLTNVQGNVVLLTKLAEEEIKGWENEFIWKPSDTDSVNFGFTLADGKLTEFTAGGHEPGAFPPIGAEFTDWSGRPIDKVSDFTAHIEYLHDWKLGNDASLQLRLATRYDSGYVVSNITDAFQLEQDAYTRSDVNFTYTAAGGSYAGLFVRNLEDDVQVLGAPEGFAPGSEGTVGVGVTEPRVFGVRFGMKF